MMKYTPGKCRHCEFIFNTSGARLHSCKDVRVNLETEVTKWKDNYLTILNKYEYLLNLKLKEPPHESETNDNA